MVVNCKCALFFVDILIGMQRLPLQGKQCRSSLYTAACSHSYTKLTCRTKPGVYSSKNSNCPCFFFPLVDLPAPSGIMAHPVIVNDLAPIHEALGGMAAHILEAVPGLPAGRVGALLHIVGGHAVLNGTAHAPHHGTDHVLHNGTVHAPHPGTGPGPRATAVADNHLHGALGE